MAGNTEKANVIKQHAISPVAGNQDLKKIVASIPPDVRFVLMGESSHGTHEWYNARAEISKLLIQERGFNAIATEADFPDAFRANLFIRGLSKEDKTSEDALQDFKEPGQS